MGLREKVTLVFLSLIFTQLTCRDCMPRRQRKTSLKSKINNLKHTSTISPIPSPPVQVNSKTKYSNVFDTVPDDRSVFKKYIFPETEYPTEISPTDPFYYGIQKDYPTEVVGKRISNPRTDALLKDLKKEVKLKRKLNKIKTENSQTKREMTSAPAFEPNPQPYCFSGAGAFPEVQYPMNAMETWAPNYWNPLPFSEPKQQLDDFELPIISANKQEIKNPLRIKTSVFSKKSKSQIGKIEFAKPKSSNKTNHEHGSFNTTDSLICNSASENTTDTGKPTQFLIDTIKSSNTTHTLTLVTDSNNIKNSFDALQFVSHDKISSNSFKTPPIETCPANLNASDAFDSEHDLYPDDIAARLLMNVRNSDLLETISLILSSDNYDPLHSSAIPLPYKITIQDIDICPVFDNSTSMSKFDEFIQVNNPVLSETGELNSQIFKSKIIDNVLGNEYFKIDSSSEDINANSLTHSLTAISDTGPLLIKFPLPLAATIPDTTPADLPACLLHNDTLPILVRSLNTMLPQTSPVSTLNILNPNSSQSSSINQFPEHTKTPNTTIVTAKHVVENTQPLTQKIQDPSFIYIDASPKESSTHNPRQMDTIIHPLDELLNNFSSIDTPLNAITNYTSQPSQSVSNIEFNNTTINMEPDSTPLVPTQLVANSSTTNNPAHVFGATIPLEIPQVLPTVSSTIPSNIEVTVHHYHHLVNDNPTTTTQTVSNLNSVNNLAYNNTITDEIPLTPIHTLPSTIETPIDSLTNKMPLTHSQTIPSTTETAIDSVTNDIPLSSTKQTPSVTEIKSDSLTDNMPFTTIQAIPSTVETPTDSLTNKILLRPTMTSQSADEIITDTLTDMMPFTSTQAMPSTVENPINSLTDKIPITRLQAMPSTTENVTDSVTNDIPLSRTQAMPTTVETPIDSLTNKKLLTPTQAMQITVENPIDSLTDKMQTTLSQAMPNLANGMPNDTSISSTTPIDSLTDKIPLTPIHALPSTIESPIDSLTNKMPLTHSQIIPSTTETAIDSVTNDIPFSSTKQTPSVTEIKSDSLTDNVPFTTIQAIPSTVETHTDSLTNNMLLTPTMTTQSAAEIITDTFTDMMPFTPTQAMPSTVENPIDSLTDEIPITRLQAMPNTTENATDSVTNDIPLISTQAMPSNVETPIVSLTNKKLLTPTQAMQSTVENLIDLLTDKMPLTTTQAMPSSVENTIHSFTDKMPLALSQAMPNTIETPKDSLTAKIPLTSTMTTQSATEIMTNPLTDKMPLTLTQAIPITAETPIDLMTDNIPFTTTTPEDSQSDKFPLPLVQLTQIPDTIMSTIDSFTDKPSLTYIQTIRGPTTLVTSDFLTDLIPVPPTRTTPSPGTSFTIDYFTDELPLPIAQTTPDIITNVTDSLTPTMLSPPTQIISTNKQHVPTQIETTILSIPGREVLTEEETIYPYIPVHAYPISTIPEPPVPTDSSVSSPPTIIDIPSFTIPMEDQCIPSETPVSSTPIKVDKALSNTSAYRIDACVNGSRAPVASDNYPTPIATSTFTVSTNNPDVSLPLLSSAYDIPLVEIPITEEDPLLKASFSADADISTVKFPNTLDVSDSVSPKEYLTINTPLSYHPMSIQLAPLNERISYSAIDKSILSEDLFLNVTYGEEIPILNSPISEVPVGEFMTSIDTSRPSKPELEILDTSLPFIPEDKIPTEVITPTVFVNKYPLTVKTKPIYNSEVPISQLPSILNKQPEILELPKSVDPPDTAIPATNDVLLPDIPTGNLISLSNDAFRNNTQSNIPTNELLSSNFDIIFNDTPLSDAPINDVQSSTTDTLKDIPFSNIFTTKKSPSITGSFRDISQTILPSTDALKDTALDSRLIDTPTDTYNNDSLIDDVLIPKNDTFEDITPLVTPSDDMQHPDNVLTKDKPFIGSQLFDSKPDTLSLFNNDELKDTSLLNLRPYDSYIDNTPIPLNDTYNDNTFKIPLHDLPLDNILKDTPAFESHPPENPSTLSDTIDDPSPPIDDILKETPFYDTPLSGTLTADQFFPFHNAVKDAQFPYSSADPLFNDAVSEIPTDEIELPNIDTNQAGVLLYSPLIIHASENYTFKGEPFVDPNSSAKLFDDLCLPNINALKDPLIGSTLLDTGTNKSLLPINDNTRSKFYADEVSVPTNNSFRDDLIISSICNTPNNDSSKNNTNENTPNYEPPSEFIVNDMPLLTEHIHFGNPPFDQLMVKNDTLIESPLSDLSYDDLLSVSHDTRQHSNTSHETIMSPSITLTQTSDNDFGYDTSIQHKNTTLHSFADNNTEDYGDAPLATDETNSNEEYPDTALDRPYPANEIPSDTTSKYQLLPENNVLSDSALTDYPINNFFDTAPSESLTDHFPTEEPQPDFSLSDNLIDDLPITTEETDSETSSEDLTLNVLSDISYKPQDFNTENALSQTTFLDTINDDLSLHMHDIDSDRARNDIPAEISFDNALSSPHNTLQYDIAHTGTTMEDVSISLDEVQKESNKVHRECPMWHFRSYNIPIVNKYSAAPPSDTPTNTRFTRE